MKLSRLIGIASLSLLLTGTSLAQEQEVCPHAKGWKPEDLQQRLSDHRQLAQETWREREEEQYERAGVFRTYSFRSSSEYLKRILESLAHGPLYEERLEVGWSKRPSGAANFCNANLRHEDLEKAVLDWADLNGADLSSAKLTNAKLRYAD